MKKSIILLIALLSLVGCATPNTKGNAKKTTYCSCYEDNPTPELDALGLNDTDKLNASPSALRSHQQLREKDNNNDILFDSHQSAVTFANELEQKAEYNNYNETIKFINSLQEDEFQDKNLLLTKQITLGSGGYSLSFDAVYLKDDVLYMHGFEFNSHSPGASGISFTMDIVFVAGYVWLDKDITYSECEFVIDQDLRQPKVIELD